MAKSRAFWVAVCCLLLATLAPAAGADYLTEWTSGSPALGVVVNSYPSFVAGESCVAQASVVYCVGGLNGTAYPTNLTYSAVLNPLGVGQWGRLSDYPTNVAGESCVVDSGYIYCVGGFERGTNSSSSPVVLAASYYSKLTSTGLGGWKRTTDYPFSVFDQSCAVSADYVYCVGGVTSNSTGVSIVEYAQLSSSGISQWNQAASYPSTVSAGSCASYEENLYCVGGLNGAFRAVSSVYHTPITARGLNWTRASSYPTPVAGHSCIIHFPGLYCVGGLNATAYASRGVFFTYLNSTNLRWIPSTFYPVKVQSQSCVTYSAYVYCVGGYDGQSFLASVYYSTIGTVQPNYSLVSTSTASGTRTVLPGSSLPWLANYGSVVVALGVAAAVIIASLASRTNPSPEKNATESRAFGAEA